jgi:hypothetical protein
VTFEFPTVAFMLNADGADKVEIAAEAPDLMPSPMLLVAATKYWYVTPPTAVWSR